MNAKISVFVIFVEVILHVLLHNLHDCTFNPSIPNFFRLCSLLLYAQLFLFLCFPAVVLKNCEPKLSYILAELFNKYLKESFFPDCWKVSSLVLVFNYCSLFSVVSKVFEKLVSNRIVDHLEKYGLFPDFHYGFRSSLSTADLLTAVSDRIARAFNRSGATRAVALDISKTFDRVRHAGLLHKLKSYGISGQIFGLTSSFLSNRQLRVVLDGRSSQEYPVNAGVPQGSILGPTLFLLYINDLPDDVICDIAMYADDTALYSSVIRHLICGNNLNWLLNLNLIYETLWTGTGSGLLISVLEKLSWFRLTGRKTLVLLI